MLTDAILRELAARASTLAERLDPASRLVAEETSADLAARRLERWREVVARGDAATFEKRLHWDGLEPSRVCEALGMLRLPEGVPLPEWTNTLRAGLSLTGPLSPASLGKEGAGPNDPASLGREGAEPNDPASLGEEGADPRRFEKRESSGAARDGHVEGRPDAQVPFQEVLEPFVSAARDTLRARTASAYSLLVTGAHATLERRLRRRLAALAAPHLELEFSILRAARQSSLSRLLAETAGARSHEIYDEFISRMLSGGLVPFVREYPVLARLLAIAVDLWVDAVAEFLLRLHTDLRLLASTFAGGEDPGLVTMISDTASDPHNGGRSVIGFRFSTGLTLVYKPKNLGLEHGYFALLAWLNAHGAPLPLATLRVLDRGAYGWVEHAEQRPCASTDAAARYFKRAGMLLCLLYALGSNDIHLENIVARGEQPLLVDLETLMQPEVDGPAEAEPGAEAVGIARRQVGDSVLGVGLLPRWTVALDGRSVDASGLGASTDQQSLYRGAQWQQINSDQMSLEEGYGSIPMLENAVTLDGRVLSASAFVEELVAGFGAMYELLLEHRTRLLAADGPLAALRASRVRFVLRPTRLYLRLLRGALSRDALRDGAVRSIELDLISRPHLDEVEPGPFWRLRCSEQRALEQMDIPLFTVSAGDLRLLEGGDEGGCRVRLCAYDRMRSRLHGLDLADMERQTILIRAALAVWSASAGDLQGGAQTKPAEERLPRSGRARNGAELRAAGVRRCTNRPGSGQALVQSLTASARRIANGLRAQAIRGADGSACWVGAVYAPRAGRFLVQPLGHDLCSGAPGVALFLAATNRVSGGAGFGALALGALQPLRAELRGHGERLAGEIGIGGGAGLGGAVYSLTRSGELLSEPALLDDAHFVASNGKTCGGPAAAVADLLSAPNCCSPCPASLRVRTCLREPGRKHSRRCGERMARTAFAGFPACQRPSPTRGCCREAPAPATNCCVSRSQIAFPQ
jgi:type 2 lantibiotic biosynthesis protein LanM